MHVAVEAIRFGTHTVHSGLAASYLIDYSARRLLLDDTAGSEVHHVEVAGLRRPHG